MPCIRHKYHTFSIAYPLPATDIDTGMQKWKWETEIRCSVCGETFENPYQELIKQEHEQE